MVDNFKRNKCSEEWKGKVSVMWCDTSCNGHTVPEWLYSTAGQHNCWTLPTPSLLSFQTEAGQDTLEEEEVPVFDDKEASSVSLPTLQHRMLCVSLYWTCCRSGCRCSRTHSSLAGSWSLTMVTAIWHLNIWHLESELYNIYDFLLVISIYDSLKPVEWIYYST